MKTLNHDWATAFLFIAFLLFPILGMTEQKQESPSKAKVSEKNPSPTIKQRYQEEMDAVKKDTIRTGQEIKESYRELPGKVGEEFKESGSALKDAWKEIKKGTAESWQSLKNLFK